LTRIVTAAVAVFVAVVIALWIRHRAAIDRHNARLAEIVATARAKDAKRVSALREAAMKGMPEEPRACPLRARVKIVRVSSMDAQGGSLHDVIASVAEQREPSPWTHELDVIGEQAFLYDYRAERVLCIGRDAEDPHGTLVAY
jgi:hypothetical protein